MYIYRQKIMHLCIVLKSINEDRLRTHVQNADLSDFLMLYLTTSLSAPWMRVLLHAYEHTHTHTRTHTHTHTLAHRYTHASADTHTKEHTMTHTQSVSRSLSFSLVFYLSFALSLTHKCAYIYI